MLDIILKILSVLGILLLALLAFALLALLLMLFLPVTYRIRGRKEAVLPPEDGQDGAVPKAGGLELTAGMNWLFGFFRVRCAWPDPGVLTVKLLCFLLFKMKLPPDGTEEKGKPRGRKEKGGKPSGDKGKAEKGKKQGPDEGGPEKEQDGLRETEPQAQRTPADGEAGREKEKEPGDQQEGNEAAHHDEASNHMESEEAGGFLKKFQKIKYTMRGVYDKIKEVWQNISYYAELLQKEATRQVFGHVKLRVFKILKNIRPRHIRADILFGTGAPDTTGCLYGVYTMFYPVLGNKCMVTPDFERKVLEGRFDVSGHITVFVLLVNIVKLALDRRLRLFIRKMKRN